MQRYNPDFHHRYSIRLKHYDYAQAGMYFITVCTQDKACIFGEISNEKMHLNEAGFAAQSSWQAIPKHFSNVELREFVTMPNHVHGIIILNSAAKNFPSIKQGCSKGTSETIGSIVRGFKIGVTKWMRQNTNIYSVWQRNYYEHIIRNENDYSRIAEYIITNPKRWHDDKLHVNQSA